MLANTIQLLANLHREILGINSVVDVFARQWRTEQFYVKNRHVRPSTPNGFFFFAQGDGVTAPNEPIWPEAEGATILDGSLTWEAVLDDDPKGWPVGQLFKEAFPQVVISEGTGDWQRLAGDSNNVRQFQITIFLHPYESAYYGIARNDSLAFTQKIGLAYMNRENNYLTPDLPFMHVIIQQHEIRGASDFGLIVTDYAGDQFYALQWNLSVAITTTVEVNT